MNEPVPSVEPKVESDKKAELEPAIEEASAPPSLCSSCDEELNEGAKFCPQCGTSTTAPEVAPEDKQESTQKRKITIPPKRETPKSKKITIPNRDPEPEEEEKPEESVDFSKIDPKEMWECFGQIEPDHEECIKCPFRIDCAKEAGVAI